MLNVLLFVRNVNADVQDVVSSEEYTSVVGG